MYEQIYIDVFHSMSEPVIRVVSLLNFVGFFDKCILQYRVCTSLIQAQKTFAIGSINRTTVKVQTCVKTSHSFLIRNHG